MYACLPLQERELHWYYAYGKTKYKIWQKFQNEMKKKTETAKFVVGKTCQNLKSIQSESGRYIKTLLLDLKLAK